MGYGKQRGIISSLVYIAGSIEVGTFVLGLICVIIFIVYSAINNPKAIFEFLKVHFWQLEYAGLMTTGIFLTIFTVGLFKPRPKERPVLDFFTTLAKAAILSFFIIYFIAIFLSDGTIPGL